jgi:hypothetical protein
MASGLWVSEIERKVPPASEKENLRRSPRLSLVWSRIKICGSRGVGRPVIWPSKGYSLNAGRVLHESEEGTSSLRSIRSFAGD